MGDFRIKDSIGECGTWQSLDYPITREMESFPLTESTTAFN